ncbi:AsmA family protein [Candidatus Auribacterota bacterium]
MFKKLILILVVLVVVIYFGKNFLIKNAITHGVKAMTGLKVEIDSMNISVVGTSVGIKGLKLYNPPQFKDRLMMDMPEISVDMYLKPLLKKKIHVESIKLDLKEFVVVKNEKGELNLDSITAVKGVEDEQEKEEQEKKGEMPEIRIDLLELKIGKVVYKDYSKGGEPKVTEVNVNIDEKFEDIDDPYKLVSIIVFKALVNTSIAQLANFDLGPLKGNVTEVMDKAKEKFKVYTDKAKDLTGTMTDKIKDLTSGSGGSGEGLSEKTKAAAEGAKDMLGDTADKIKDFFPFGGKKEEAK